MPPTAALTGGVPREDLIAKYSADTSVDTERIEEVDFVWQGGSLVDAVPLDQHGTYDAFIASHVIERTTDVVTFLKASETPIRPNGIIILAVPDKRKRFDFYRHPSRTADANLAFQENRVRHDTRTQFESAMRAAHKGGAPGWHASDTRETVIARPFEQAHQQLGTAARPEYIDAHNWVFVPASFQLMLLELAAMSYLNLHIEEITEASATEFYVWLRKGKIAIDHADLQIRRRDLMHLIIIELAQHVKQLPDNTWRRLQNEIISLDQLAESSFRTEDKK